jgi:transcriptional regulator with XRE-family HTH domain
MNRADRIWDYVDGHNDRRHPDPLDAMRDGSDAAVIHLFHEVRPPILDDDAKTLRRALVRVRKLTADGEQSASAQLGPLLLSLRRRLGLTRRELVGRLGIELDLPDASLSKLKRYYADLENGLLSASRLAPELYAALGRTLAADPEELSGAARFSVPLTHPQARALARVANASTTRPVPPNAPVWDRVDALFLGARGDNS